MSSMCIHRMTYGNPLCQWNLGNRLLGSDKIHSLMAKETRLTFRVSSDLKKGIEAIAAKEARSVAQICEIILKSGLDAYDKEGSKYFHKLISHKSGGSNK